MVPALVVLTLLTVFLIWVFAPAAEKAAKDQIRRLDGSTAFVTGDAGWSGGDACGHSGDSCT